MTQGIYGLYNTVSDKWYVGQSVNVEKRWMYHRTALSSTGYKISNRHLQAAWNKYGGAAFEFSVLEEVPDVERLTKREEFWIAAKRQAAVGVYNTRVAADSNRGVGHSCSLDARAKISAALTGKKLSAERCAHMSAGQKGKVFSETHRANLSAAAKGKKKSAETCAKISAAKKGKKQPPELIEKRAAARRGSKQSAETVRKRVLALTLFSLDDVVYIRSLRSCGNTYSSIAAIMKCSVTSVARVVNGLGVYAYSEGIK